MPGMESAGTRTNRNQIRIGNVAEFFADQFFGLGEGVKNLFFNIRRDLFAIFIITGAGFSSDCETTGNR